MRRRRRVPRYPLGYMARILISGREARGWSQEEVARQTGIQQGTLSRWEVRDTLPQPEFFEMIKVFIPDLSIYEFRRALILDQVEAFRMDNELAGEELAELVATCNTDRPLRRAEDAHPKFRAKSPTNREPAVMEN